MDPLDPLYHLTIEASQIIVHKNILECNKKYNLLTRKKYNLLTRKKLIRNSERTRISALFIIIKKIKLLESFHQEHYHHHQSDLKLTISLI